MILDCLYSIRVVLFFMFVFVYKADKVIPLLLVKITNHAWPFFLNHKPTLFWTYIHFTLQSSKDSIFYNDVCYVNWCESPPLNVAKWTSLFSFCWYQIPEYAQLIVFIFYYSQRFCSFSLQLQSHKNFLTMRNFCNIFKTIEGYIYI